LVGPDVSRRAIIEFKKSIDRRKLEALGRRAMLERERADLHMKLTKLQQQAQVLGAQLKEIENSLALTSNAFLIEGEAE
jgi:hypothetical protein